MIKKFLKKINKGGKQTNKQKQIKINKLDDHQAGFIGKKILLYK